MIEKAPLLKQNENIINLLVDLLASGDLKTMQDDYIYWDKAKYKAKKINPEDFWSAIKLYRKTNSNVINFGNYKFYYVVTDFIQRSLHQFDLNIGGTLGSNIGISDTDKTKFIISSIMDEAINSSQMEGANTSRKVAKEMIQQNKKPKTKSEIMIMNNYLTMNHIIKHKNDNLTPENLLHIHALIAKNTLESPEEEGRFRQNDDILVINSINGETVHVPPHNIELVSLISDLCAFFNNESKNFIHPIIKGCIIHFMIGWIHPFSDGNGRTARALFYWYMLKNGYWLTEYLSISRIIKDSKEKYEKSYLYSEIDDNDLSYFITYHIKTMDLAYDSLKSYIGKKQGEVMQAAKFLKIPNINDRSAQILKMLYDDSDRVLSVKEIEKRFNISNFTARTDLKSLVDKKLIEIIRVNKIKQNFIKSKDFDTILKNFNL
ncbi:MAG: Fic family protein [Cytophagales bacterium]|nr:MAG: Fic family protein [Cytophagales bacterium]